MDFSIKLRHMEWTDNDDEYTLEKENFFGLYIAFDPYCREIVYDDRIFELGCKLGNNITRVLYFFFYEGEIILTNGFVKKTNKTPREEIKLAKDRRKDYIERIIGK